MIIETSVWCESENEYAGMGLPKEDCWMPFIFNVGDVIGVKLAGESDFLGNDKATIYMKSGESFVIQTTFREMTQHFSYYDKHYKDK